MGKQWKHWEILFWGGSKITADGNCSNEIKRHLLLGRNPMTNLDSILRSRDITLPTKAHLVKALVFPVVIYGCDSWAIKKSWVPKNWCFWTVLGEDPWESLRLQGDSTSQSYRKSVLNIHWKDWCWSWNSNTLTHLMWRLIICLPYHRTKCHLSY